MYPKISIHCADYGGFRAYSWELHLSENKSFYLGQDVKFCSRVLGVSPAFLCEEIGGNDLYDPETNKRLAEYIVDTLNVTEDMASWAIAAD